MDLPPLLAGAALPPAAEAEIERLRQRKADAIETDLVDRSAVLETFPTETLRTPEPKPASWNRTGSLARADSLFRRLIGQ